MDSQKHTLFSVEQAIDAAKWDKHSTWHEIIRNRNSQSKPKDEKKVKKPKKVLSPL